MDNQQYDTDIVSTEYVDGQWGNFGATFARVRALDWANAAHYTAIFG